MGSAQVGSQCCRPGCVRGERTRRLSAIRGGFSMTGSAPEREACCVRRACVCERGRREKCRKATPWVRLRRRPWRMRIGDEGGRETRHTSSGGAGRVALPWRVEAVLMFAVPSRNSIAGKRKKSARRSPLLRRLGRLDGADALPPCSSLWCGAWRAVSRPQRGGGVDARRARARGIGFYSRPRSWFAADGGDGIWTRVGLRRPLG